MKSYIRSLMLYSFKQMSKLLPKAVISQNVKLSYEKNSVTFLELPNAFLTHPSQQKVLKTRASGIFH